MRGQRGSNCDGGRSENGGARRRRGPAGGSGGTHGFPEGTGGGGGGGRGVSTYHTPSIPKSRGRLATRQIVVAGKARSSTVAAGVARKGGGREGREIKKYREKGGERVRRAWTWGEGEGEVKERRKFATRVRRSFSMGRGEKK